MNKNQAMEDLKNKVCLITGGAGIIGTAIAEGLARAGVHCAILDRNEQTSRSLADMLTRSTGVVCYAVQADVLDRVSLEAAKQKIFAETGRVDFLINGAGGNHPGATTAAEQIDPKLRQEFAGTFFGLDMEGFRQVMDLNFIGTLLPTMVFAEEMVRQGSGSVINISSMNSFRPLTRIPAYSAAKASVNNLTQWLAVHFALTGVRVNAIAPGFFLTKQNKFLLIDENTGEPTPRGRKIIANTPMARYGDPAELVGATLFLLSDISSFITGIVIPVDGGYSAFGGV